MPFLKGNRYSVGNKSFTGRTHSEETRQKLRMSMKGNRNWMNSSKKLFDTSIELKVEKELKFRNIKYRKQAFICRHSVDFYLLGYKVVIECDGDYWHNLPGAKEKDNAKDKDLKKRGYKVLRFWEHEINNDFEKVSDKIINSLSL
jgi:very-short-patch-repair endonuclease